MANGGELTYFAQLPLEHEFQDSAPSGIFNGIFGRFFKSTQNSPIDISEARVADNVQSSIAATNCKDDTNSNEASSTGWHINIFYGTTTMCFKEQLSLSKINV